MRISADWYFGMQPEIGMSFSVSVPSTRDSLNLQLGDSVQNHPRKRNMGLRTAFCKKRFRFLQNNCEKNK